MQLKITNKIKVDQETEIIEESHPCEVIEKGGNTYLIYRNSEDEKVIVKFTQDELVMTRYSTPKSVMRFSPKMPALVHIPTPLGTQHFATETSLFVLDSIGQSIIIHYQLKQVDGEQVFADYELALIWF